MFQNSVLGRGSEITTLSKGPQKLTRRLKYQGPIRWCRRPHPTFLSTGPARTIGLRNADQICETWRTSVLSDAICTVTRARLIKFGA